MQRERMKCYLHIVQGMIYKTVKEEAITPQLFKGITHIYLYIAYLHYQVIIYPWNIPCLCFARDAVVVFLPQICHFTLYLKELALTYGPLFTMQFM